MDMLRCSCCLQPSSLLNLNVKISSLQYSACSCKGIGVCNPSPFPKRRRSILLGHFGFKPRIGATENAGDVHTSTEVNNIQEDHELRARAVEDRTSHKLETSTTEGPANKEGIMLKLRKYGVAGVLSYGLLNTVYYLGMFLFAWFYVSPVPGGLGYKAAAERFVKLFALVWAGSQVTKLPRACCALALAPAIDHGLTWFTKHFKFQSRGKAFGTIVAACFALAMVVFVIITSLWA